MADAAHKTKAAIDFVCRVLCSFGMEYVTAEHFRRAKYNEDDVVPLFWVLVGDLVELRLASGGGDAQSTRVLSPLTPVRGTAPSKSAPSATEVSRLSTMLLAFGYPRADSLIGGQKSSRELLLAVGFLLDDSNIIDAFRKNRASAHNDGNGEVSLPPYPLDVRNLTSVVRGAKEMQQHSASVRSVLKQASQKNLWMEIRVTSRHYVMWCCSYMGDGEQKHEEQKTWKCSVSGCLAVYKSRWVWLWQRSQENLLYSD